jgi:hypothetical protein
MASEHLGIDISPEEFPISFTNKSDDTQKPDKY